MAMAETVSPFFSLPLELREQIYQSLLSSPAQGSDVLRTCHEIYTEARKFLYQRPLTFRSQAVLYTWLANAPKELLSHVSKICLNVQDVDLNPILSAEDSIDQSCTPPRLMTWELYKAELARLEQALRRIPTVKSITIRAPSSQHSFLYHKFMTGILDMLSPLFPDLLDLQLDGNFHHQNLAFLSGLKHLESFSFDGFSSSLPAATAKILSSLQHLNNLSLFSQHATLAPEFGLHSAVTAKRQSFTGDVVRTISRLASFSVTERDPGLSPTLFFTSEVLSSLQDHKTLKGLSIHLSHTPDDETLESLGNFLERSSIERLELDWPDLHPSVLERYRLLGGSLKVLWVRAKSEAHAFEILLSISESREGGDIRKLKKVGLVRSTENYGHVHTMIGDRKESKIGPSDRKTCNVCFSPRPSVHLFTKGRRCNSNASRTG